MVQMKKMTNLERRENIIHTFNMKLKESKILKRIIGISLLVGITGSIWYANLFNSRNAPTDISKGLSTNVAVLGGVNPSHSGCFLHSEISSGTGVNESLSSRTINYNGMMGSISFNEETGQVTIHLNYNNTPKTTLSITRNQKRYLNTKNIFIPQGYEIPIAPGFCEPTIECQEKKKDQAEDVKTFQNKTKTRSFAKKPKTEISSVLVNEMTYEQHLEKTNYTPGPIERHFDYSDYVDQKWLQKEEIKFETANRENHARQQVLERANWEYSRYRKHFCSNKPQRYSYSTSRFSSFYPQRSVLSFSDFCRLSSRFHTLDPRVDIKTEFMSLNSVKAQLCQRKIHRNALLSDIQQSRLVSLKNLHSCSEHYYQCKDWEKSQVCHLVKQHLSAEFERVGLDNMPQAIQGLNTVLKTANAPLFLNIFTNPCFIGYLRAIAT